MNSKFRGEITRVPDSINPNKLIMEAMDKKYGVCPFCGEYRRADLIVCHNKLGIRKLASESWYGKQRKSLLWFLKFWEPNHVWRIDRWECKTCGAEWKSEPFPTDIKGGESLSNIFTYKISELGITSGEEINNGNS